MNPAFSSEFAGMQLLQIDFVIIQSYIILNALVRLCKNRKEI